MQVFHNDLILSATNLWNFNCRHRRALEIAEAQGKRKGPKRVDPPLEILFERGLEHEKAYVESLRTEGRDIVGLSDIKDADAAVARTLEAIRSGADVIVQAALRDGCWCGRPDAMLRVKMSSGLRTCTKSPIRSSLGRRVQEQSCSLDSIPRWLASHRAGVRNLFMSLL
jgi:uncharacterized protein